MNDKQRTNKYLDGTWQEFETWIKNTIGSFFRWRICPADTRSKQGDDRKSHPGRY